MSDWTTQAADAVEKAVVLVRDRTVVPAEQASRAIVYGLLAASCAALAVTLLAIVLFRLLCIALPVWAAWMVLGGIFLGIGAFTWSRRSRSDPQDAASV